MVCVTKGVAEDKVREAIAAGVLDVGESKVQEASSKRVRLAQAADSVSWHLIGHLQTNKAARAVAIFDLIHSVDSSRLARDINSKAGAAGKIQNVLIEVKISGEDSKYGCSPKAAPALAKEIAGLKNLRLCGVMAMAPYFADPEDARPYFASARKVCEAIPESLAAPNPYSGVPVLSMGMSGDFEVAIEEGANMVRIGTSIFK